MKSGGLPRTIDPDVHEGADDRRPERPETVSPHLVLLLRGVAPIDEVPPVNAEVEGLHDNFDAARGIVLATALGTSLWIVTGGVVWWFVR